MSPGPLKVVLDANALYPFTLRDTLLRSAAEGLFQVCWSERILDEVARNLVRDGLMTSHQAGRLRAAMSAAFPEALVEGYEHLVASMRNDPKDRHVAAAAVKARAQIIVTANLRDFTRLPEGIQAQSPDTFLCNLFHADADTLVEVVRSQAAALRRPPRSFEDILRSLEKVVPTFAARVREHGRAGA